MCNWPIQSIETMHIDSTGNRWIYIKSIILLNYIKNKEYNSLMLWKDNIRQSLHMDFILLFQ